MSDFEIGASINYLDESYIKYSHYQDKVLMQKLRAEIDSGRYEFEIYRLKNSKGKITNTSKHYIFQLPNGVRFNYGYQIASRE